jgi:hypothetical protein
MKARPWTGGPGQDWVPSGEGGGVERCCSASAVRLAPWRRRRLWPSACRRTGSCSSAAGVELPAAALLYAHFRTLAARVPGRDRRALFDLLRWLVPSVVAAGAALIAASWFRDNGTPLVRGGNNRFALAVAYGVAAVTSGVIASAAVGSLALTYCAAAFPDTWRVVGGTRRVARASWRWFSSADGLRVRSAVWRRGWACWSSWRCWERPRPLVHRPQCPHEQSPFLQLPRAPSCSRRRRCRNWAARRYGRRLFRRRSWSP